jgi:hypothetical protein
VTRIAYLKYHYKQRMRVVVLRRLEDEEIKSNVGEVP